MAKNVGRNPAQKEFARLFDSLTGARNRWEIWQDMIWLFATAISNRVDTRRTEEREEIYAKTIGKYSKTEQQVFPELFAMLTMAMEEQDGYCDFLGELFMMLEINFKGAGQFFTPYSVCEMMAHMNFDIETAKAAIAKKGYVAVHDPACGAGATLIGAAATLRAAGINYQRQAVFVGQDLDSNVALMCYIQLSLLGCPGFVVVGDTLNNPSTTNILYGEDSSRCWCTPMFFSDDMELLRMREKAQIVFGGARGRQ